MGGDVIAVKDYEFPNGSELGFLMFNYANTKRDHTARAGDRKILGGSSYFKYYLNCDIRFYGNAMDVNIWKIGDAWFDDWQNYWEYEQDLWNAMFRESYRNRDIEFDINKINS